MRDSLSPSLERVPKITPRADVLALLAGRATAQPTVATPTVLAPAAPVPTAAPTVSAASPASAPSGAPERDADADRHRFVTYHGMSALLAGEVHGYAYELVGHEVATKAVFAGLVNPINRVTPKALLDGELFALASDVNYRTLSASLAGGNVSIVLLHADAVNGAPATETTKATKKRRRSTRDETREGEKTEMRYVYRTVTADPVSGLPAGFGDALAQQLRLPFRLEWAPQLWAAGRAQGMIADLLASGTLRGVRVSLRSEDWTPILGEIARAVYAATEAVRAA